MHRTRGRRMELQRAALMVPHKTLMWLTLSLLTPSSHLQQRVNVAMQLRLDKEDSHNAMLLIKLAVPEKTSASSMYARTCKRYTAKMRPSEERH